MSTHLQGESLQHPQTTDNRNIEWRQAERKLVHDITELSHHIPEVEVSDSRVQHVRKRFLFK